ncbi:hypothetical protein MHU86_9416 [Fragilaria crotonensis]|nr:hypothetical protein MHU86_9416 [Fragilaria crotonensis]
MAPALPGAKGLFSVLQAVLSKADRHRVKLNRRVYDVAADLRALVDDLARRPTRLRELVPTSPSDVGACDACRRGMGGVWFDTLDPQSPPIVWRQAFPSHIADTLVTAEHPQGTLSISDLELTALIAHKDILAHSRDIAERTLWLCSDNKAAVSWSDKGASTSWGARAYLLRYNALHQRHHRYVTRHHYVPGPVNVMADDASRRWDLSNDALLTHFNATYPQAVSWQMQTLPSDTVASLIGALSKTRPTHGALTNGLPTPPPPGNSGRPSRYRDGSIAPGRRPVRARTVEDAVRTVGQAYTRLGAPDPRLNIHGSVDYRLTSLYRAWQRADEPPSRVKPLPLTLVAQVWHYAHQDASPQTTAAASCLVIGFFFLLRPENGVRNETVGYGRSGHPTLCPVHCLGLRAIALREAGGTPDTPLNAVRLDPTASWTYIHPSDLTSRLRATLHLHPDPAYTMRDVSIRSTRAGGAMALLCAGVDSDSIRLVGRWRSDEMYRYLHVQAQPVMTGLSAAMLRGGSFRLTPG